MVEKLTETEIEETLRKVMDNSMPSYQEALDLYQRRIDLLTYTDRDLGKVMKAEEILAVLIGVMRATAQIAVQSQFEKKGFEEIHSVVWDEMTRNLLDNEEDKTCH